METHVLVVLPHPDDESFGCAGTIAHYTKAGIPVTYMCGTKGEMGRHMGRPFFATREALADVREKELKDACDVLGIQDLRMMGLRDKTIEFEDREQLADRIEAVIRELRPSLIITHYPGHGVHPDHDGLGAATVLAASRIPKDERPPVYCMAITRNRMDALGNPNVTIDTSDVADIKLAAIKAHRSQSEGILTEMEERALKDPETKALLDNRFRKEVYWTYPYSD